jgi:hypothetical protein
VLLCYLAKILEEFSSQLDLNLINKLTQRTLSRHILAQEQQLAYVESILKKLPADGLKDALHFTSNQKKIYLPTQLHVVYLLSKYYPDSKETTQALEHFLLNKLESYSEFERVTNSNTLTQLNTLLGLDKAWEISVQKWGSDFERSMRGLVDR